MAQIWYSDQRFTFLNLIFAGTAVLFLYFPPYGEWWPLLLFGVPWVGYFIVYKKMPIRHSPLDLFLFVFGITAVIGVWAAYNTEAALATLWLIVGAILFFYAITARQTDPPELLLGFVCCLALIVSGSFLLLHDWYETPASFSFANDVSAKWMSFRPTLNVQIDPNSAEGIMVIVLPLVVLLFVWAIKAKRIRLVILSGLTIGVMLSALFFTTSRGAWVTLLAGFAFLIILSGINRFSKQLVTKKSIIFLCTILIIGIFMLTILSIRNLAEDNLLLIFGNDLGSSRLLLTLNTLDLIQDFPFTGGGLSAFSGLYSHYILLIPYHYSTHSHNLFLNVALEQGLFGAFALVGILLITVILLISQPIEIDSLLPNWLIKGTLVACLLALVIHGLIDDPLYSSVGILFLFLIPGIIISWIAPAQQRDSWSFIDKWVTIFLGVAILLLLLSIIIYKPLTARWQANIGAVNMAKVELKEWPTVEWNDGSKVIFLISDEIRFEQSLIANSKIRTSYHRLGHIAMLRNDYDDAIPYLQMAYSIDPYHNGIKKALGYSYVWVGDIDSALEILDGFPEAETELQTYTWWWGTKGRKDLADQAFAALSRMEE